MRCPQNMSQPALRWPRQFLRRTTVAVRATRISLDRLLPLQSPVVGIHGFKVLMGLLWAAVGLTGRRSCLPARSFIKDRPSKKKPSKMTSAPVHLPLSRVRVIARSSPLFFRRRQLSGRLRIWKARLPRSSLPPQQILSTALRQLKIARASPLFFRRR
jgi:hypothetical protein